MESQEGAKSPSEHGWKWLGRRLKPGVQGLSWVVSARGIPQPAPEAAATVRRRLFLRPQVETGSHPSDPIRHKKRGLTF